MTHWQLHRLQGRKRVLLAEVMLPEGVQYMWPSWTQVEAGRYQTTVKRGRRVLSRHTFVRG